MGHGSQRAWICTSYNFGFCIPAVTPFQLDYGAIIATLLPMSILNDDVVLFRPQDPSENHPADSTVTTKGKTDTED